jgi:23S rRNA (cytosine1962-C5)-methyltransferase
VTTHGGSNVGFYDADSPIAVRVLGAVGDIGAGAARTCACVCADSAAGERPAEAVRARLAERLKQRQAAFDPSVTNAFRWVHGEADGLPGLHLDLYNNHASYRLDGKGARAFYTGVGLPGLLREAAAEGGIDLRTVRDREDDTAANEAAEGPGMVEVLENGYRFEVDVTGQKVRPPSYAQRGCCEVSMRYGLPTCVRGWRLRALSACGQGGLFLDQRDNRALVGSIAAYKTVLNLFSFTGAFSVYCAANKAQSVDSVDISAPVIAQAR